MNILQMGVKFKENANLIGNLLKGWNYIRKTEVVVGITEESNASREGIDNASLLYLHENGIPSHNIPPRPVLKPAIAQEDVRKQIQELLRAGMSAALLQGDTGKAEQMYSRAGMVGRAACQKYITDGSNLAPNAPSTIERKGSSKPLIDTGSMLGSITYAVRKKK